MQRRKIVFGYIFKYREESWKYDAQQSIFDELWSVWKCDQTLSWLFWYMFSTETETKKKTKK